ncbi:HAMP domain-containing histidine kinase [candidate division WOR-3 bacterium]|nr:HAMP domain-containing histidine kinase [candidate division WOR-3 bacterium]
MNVRRFLQIYAVAGLLVLAVFWAFYSQRLLKKLQQETLFRSRLYASYIEAAGFQEGGMLLENLLFEEVVSKIDFPVIITDTSGSPITFRNLPEQDTSTESILQAITQLDRQSKPIPIRAEIPKIDSVTGDSAGLDTVTLNILHYGLPESWSMLQYFPLIQTTFIALFIVLGFVFIFFSARRAQDRLWVALAREAAHQLGTPISSLLGWHELIRPRIKKDAAAEIDEDLNRIRDILDRFARIGDRPHREPHEIKPLIQRTIDFMKHRAPSRIEFNAETLQDAQLLIDPTLISWVLENLIRNGIDAIGRKSGTITVIGEILPNNKYYVITVIDTGTGVSSKHIRDIFRTGFSTKKHGWGIGLALSRRVIRQLHHGKLKLKATRPGHTVFSITLPIWHE